MWLLLGVGSCLVVVVGMILWFILVFMGFGMGCWMLGRGGWWGIGLWGIMGVKILMCLSWWGGVGFILRLILMGVGVGILWCGFFLMGGIGWGWLIMGWRVVLGFGFWGRFGVFLFSCSLWIKFWNVLRWWGVDCLFKVKFFCYFIVKIWNIIVFFFVEFYFLMYFFNF